MVALNVLALKGALGDSISAGGGEGPFFYDLLVANDDTTYPAWHGKDLQTRYGIGKIKVNTAATGADTTTFVAHFLGGA